MLNSLLIKPKKIFECFVYFCMCSVCMLIIVFLREIVPYFRLLFVILSYLPDPRPTLCIKFLSIYRERKITRYSSLNSLERFFIASKVSQASLAEVIWLIKRHMRGSHEVWITCKAMAFFLVQTFKAASFLGSRSTSVPLTMSHRSWAIK